MVSPRKIRAVKARAEVSEKKVAQRNRRTSKRLERALRADAGSKIAEAMLAAAISLVTLAEGLQGQAEFDHADMLDALESMQKTIASVIRILSKGDNFT